MDLAEKLKIIERLGRLRAEGALTDEEFTAEKARLLEDHEPPRTERTAAPEASPQPAVEFDARDHDDYQPGWGGGYEDKSGATAKWVGAAGALLLVVGVGYWFGQTSAAAPPDALPEQIRDKSTASTAPALPARQLAGTWTPDENCASDDGFRLADDGTVAIAGREGTWALEGDQLVTFEDGDRHATRIVSLAGGRLSLRYADGSTVSFRRCSSDEVTAANQSGEAAALEAAADAIERAGMAAEAAVDNLADAEPAGTGTTTN